MVREEECWRIAEIFSRIPLEDMKNSTRKNVMREGVTEVMSLVLGVNPKTGHRPNYRNEARPVLRELEKALSSLMKAHDPAFDFSTITINKNLQCKKHRDRGNSTDSYIISFGE